jgi:Fe-S-cluster containining protein
MAEEESKSPLVRAVVAAATREDVAAALETMYCELGERTAERRPRCDRSGRCCRFEEFGHRLYVTTIELAGFVRGMRDALARPRPSWDGTGCPYQKDGLCSVHVIRPFGCRLFFCDLTSVDWQEESYRELHGRLRDLHDSLHVPYFYVEWREALIKLGLSVPSRAGDVGKSGSLPVLSRQQGSL